MSEDDLVKRATTPIEEWCNQALARISALEAALAKADELALQVDGPHIWMEKVYHAAAAYRQARDATR